MSVAYLAIGSNLGNRLSYINKAKRLISLKAGKVINSSSVYETEPWGFIDNYLFLNLVLQIETELSVKDLLSVILKIEKTLGRERKDYYTSRTIDIDILFYNNEHITLAYLTIPHPLLQERKFVLIPLAEIAKGYIHPVFHKSIGSLLKNCKDKGKVMRY